MFVVRLKSIKRMILISTKGQKILLGRVAGYPNAHIQGCHRSASVILHCDYFVFDFPPHLQCNDEPQHRKIHPIVKK